MPRPHPPEFHRDVVAVARKHEAPQNQIAKDLGISESCLANWLKKADVEEGVKPGVTEKQSIELRDVKKRIRLLEQEAEVMRRSRLPVPGRQPKMMYPLVLEMAVNGVPVTVTCRVLRFSTQPFYPWKRNPDSERDWDGTHRTNAAWDAHKGRPRAFGHRYIADKLHQVGLTAGENRVWRRCSQQRLWSVFAKKRGLTRKADPPVHDDHVKRKFTATRPNQLWLTDIRTPHR